jgi:adenosylmethionine-8-amino-7-oxononanoate aminotransferase
MAGVEFVKDGETKEPFPPELDVAGQVMDAAMERGLIIFPGHGSVDGVMGDHILIGPPLTIERNQVEEMIGILRTSIETVQKKLKLSG